MEDISEVLQSAKFILWDFDGCFCDTEPLHFQAYAKVFAEVHHPISESHYYQRFIFQGEGAKQEIEEFKLDLSVSETLLRKKINYDALCAMQPPKIFEGINQILHIQKKLGAKIAIASNSPAEEIKNILNNAHLSEPLDLIQGREDTLKKKPAPDIFLKALEKLGGSADQALIFEDSERGLEAAKRASIRAIRVVNNINVRFPISEPFIAQLSHAEVLLHYQKTLSITST